MGQNGRKAYGASGAECLILGGGRYLSLCSQVVQKGLNFKRAQIGGVAPTVKQEIALGSLQVGFFGAVGKVFDST